MSRGKLVKNYTISCCRWVVDCEAPQYKQRALDHYRDCWTVLLDFLRSENLLKDPTLGSSVSDWLEFKIQASDVTNEGIALMQLCLGTWNPAYGQGRTQRHLVQWKKKLAKLRNGK